MPEAADDGFFAVWETYRKVVAGDYMRHRSLAGALNETLRRRFGALPFSLLDLGCGDGATLAPMLAGLRLKSYCGVDLSKTALDLAASRLTNLGCPAKLVHGDMLAGLADAAPHDAIFTSFALHHLPTADKGRFFALAAQRLNPGGLLLVVDILREDDESLDDFRRGYCAWVRESWSGLDKAERDFICAHVVASDLPEPLAVLKAQAQVAGLDAAPEVFRHAWHRGLPFAAPH